MSDTGMVQLVEFLSVVRARIDLDCPEGRPIVVVTVRPEPDRSWRPHNLGLTAAQAERLRDDLTALLKTPATFLLLAVLAMTSGGCSAKVEVVNERSVAVQTESESVEAPPASVRHRTAVEIDFLGQPAEPDPNPVAGERQATAEAEGESGDVHGDVTLIVIKEVHKHRHLHLPIVAGRDRWESCDDEAERIRRIHEMKKRQYGYR